MYVTNHSKDGIGDSPFIESLRAEVSQIHLVSYRRGASDQLGCLLELDSFFLL